jgi:phospholipid transport system transporter-binding protein
VIRIDGEVLRLEQGVTMNTVASHVKAGREAVAAGVGVIDCGALTEADSAALALLLDWQRCARAAGRPLAVRGLPEGLASLAGLYGVAELLPVA